MEIKEANHQATISLTGHSLGGGMTRLTGMFFGQQTITVDQVLFHAGANNATCQQLVVYLADLYLNHPHSPVYCRAAA